MEIRQGGWGGRVNKGNLRKLVGVVDYWLKLGHLRADLSTQHGRVCPQLRLLPHQRLGHFVFQLGQGGSRLPLTRLGWSNTGAL